MNGKEGKISTRLCKFISKLHVSPNGLSINCNFRWCDRVRSILDSTDYQIVWDNPSLFTNKCKKELSESLKGTFKEKWLIDVNTNSQCELYKVFKNVHCMESYLTMLDGHEKFYIGKFRMRVHNLPGTKSRFVKDECVDVSCNLCNSGETGDEYHYLFVCKYFETDRQTLFPDGIEKSRVFNISKWNFAFKQEKRHLTKLAFFLKTVLSHFCYEPKLLPVETNKSPELNFVLTNHTTRGGRKTKPPVRYE